MKKYFATFTSPLLLCLLAAFGSVSCTKPGTTSDAQTQQPGRPAMSNEEKAVETFNDFIDMMQQHADVQTRASVAPAQVISVRHTLASAYADTPQTRATDGDDESLPIYELTLQNPDMTTGFAVVADPETVDQVIGYAQVGAISDTIFNAGLADYFQELSILKRYAYVSDSIRYDAGSKWEIAEGPLIPTGPDYIDEPRQAGWEHIFNKQVTPKELYKHLTLEEYLALPHYDDNPGFDSFFDGPIDSMAVVSSYVPTLWGQKNPYNNLVPHFYTNKDTGLQERNQVGCYPVAVGQIMAYHRYPTTYNWSAMTASAIIPPTVAIVSPTPAQSEVARLLHDIGLASGTSWTSYDGFGSTLSSRMTTGLEAMGYEVTDVDCGSDGVRGADIKNELRNHRPVLVRGTSTAGAHIWVVDGLLTYGCWEYYTETMWDRTPESEKVLFRYRVEGDLAHCNWGWDGDSDGWYWNFYPKHGDDGVVMFNSDVHLYKGIQPEK